MSIQNVGHFLRSNEPFEEDSDVAVLEFHPAWVHLEPIALAMTAAWGAWCRRQGKTVVVENLSRRADYAARMRLFHHLGVDYDPGIVEHEEAGRFLPISQINQRDQVASVIANISALLHLQDDPESLAAVQYCVSELIRNVLEHSGSPDGAFVCAHRYTGSSTPRVTIAVADCGRGIASHLARAHPEAASSDMVALGLAMKPGVTGALRGPYGTADNAGAGLFITRCIAKGTGGYFLLLQDQQPTGYDVPRVTKIRLSCMQMPSTKIVTIDGNSHPLGRGRQFLSKSAQIRLPIIAASLSGFSGISQAAHLQLGGFASHD